MTNKKSKKDNITSGIETINCPMGCKKGEKPLQILPTELIEHMAKQHPKELRVNKATLAELAQKENSKQLPEWQKILDAECKAKGHVYITIIVGNKPDGTPSFNVCSNGDIFQMKGILYDFLNRSTK